MCRWPGVFCFFILSWCTLHASGAPPKLNAIFPSGAERGTSITVTAAGTFGKWPVKAWVDRPGIEVVAATEKNNLKVTVAPDAQPGVYWIRLYDDDGATSPRPFIVGTLTELNENEPNDDRLKPQTTGSQPIVINGRLNRATDVDCYAISLYEGQTLVASVEAHRVLGSPMDSVLEIVSPAGFVVEENDDYHDLDSQCVFTVPSDGTYVMRIFGFPATPTATIGFAGGDDFVYRLTITSGPFVEYAYPLVVASGSATSEPSQSPDGVGITTVELNGWNIPLDSKLLSLSLTRTGRLVELSPPGMASRSAIRLERHRVAVEREPNGRDMPQELQVPVTITGRIDTRGDVDVYRCRVKKGEQLLFRAESRQLGFPLDPFMRLTDPAGKVLAEVDDSGAGRDAEIRFTAPDEGEVHLLIRDLNGQGGDGYVYCLKAAAAEPDYTLKSAADSFELTSGKPLEIPVTIERANGFASEVEFVVEGLFDGITAATVTSAATGDTSKAVKIVISGAVKSVTNGQFRIVGRVKGDPLLDREVEAALANLNASTSQLWLTALP
jgi:hypothetical protein